MAGIPPGRFLNKGREVAVEGRIVNRTYEDKKGIIKYITEIVLIDLILLRLGKEQAKDEQGKD